MNGYDDWSDLFDIKATRDGVEFRKKVNHHMEDDSSRVTACGVPYRILPTGDKVMVEWSAVTCPHCLLS